MADTGCCISVKEEDQGEESEAFGARKRDTQTETNILVQVSSAPLGINNYSKFSVTCWLSAATQELS